MDTKHTVTVFENRPKSRTQLCERSELRLHFEWTKVNQKCQKWSIWQFFENLNLRSNSVPDKSILNGQKLVENALIKKKLNETF